MNDVVDQLASAWRALDLQWAETRGLWRDSVQRHFAEEYWRALEKTTRATLGATRSMSETLSRMEREVPPRGRG